MESIDKYKQVVKEQMMFHEQRSQYFSSISPNRSGKHAQTAERFRELLEYLDALPQMLGATTTITHHQRPTQLRLSLRLEDLDGLPEDLLSELSTSGAENKTEMAILAMIQQAGGVMSLDQILVGVYRRTGEVHKRAALTNRLYRMAQKGTIFSVPGKKGAYSDTRLNEQDVAELFGEPPKESDPSEDGS